MQLPIYRDPNFDQALKLACEEFGIPAEHLPKLIDLICRLHADVSRQEFIIMRNSRKMSNFEERIAILEKKA